MRGSDPLRPMGHCIGMVYRSWAFLQRQVNNTRYLRVSFSVFLTRSAPGSRFLSISLRMLLFPSVGPVLSTSPPVLVAFRPFFIFVPVHVFDPLYACISLSLSSSLFAHVVGTGSFPHFSSFLLVFPSHATIGEGDRFGRFLPRRR